jgi:hypothetical protein
MGGLSEIDWVAPAVKSLPLLLAIFTSAGLVVFRVCPASHLPCQETKMGMDVA